MDHYPAADENHIETQQSEDLADDPRHLAESSRTIPQGAEGSGNMPRDAEVIGKIPQSTVDSRSMPHTSEKTEHHTLIVRDVVRIFEDSGVSRSERTIVSWCQRNALGASKLDAFYDFGERRYYITPESVRRAIQEELSKRNSSASMSSTHEPADGPREPSNLRSANGAEYDLRIRDLEIASRAKDMYIQRLETERTDLIDKMMAASSETGRLKAELLQIEEQIDHPL